MKIDLSHGVLETLRESPKGVKFLKYELNDYEDDNKIKKLNSKLNLQIHLLIS
jgi:hypothetical protein